MPGQAVTAAPTPTRPGAKRAQNGVGGGAVPVRPNEPRQGARRRRAALYAVPPIRGNAPKVPCPGLQGGKVAHLAGWVRLGLGRRFQDD